MECLCPMPIRQGGDRPRRPLRVITYLAPNLFWFYESISRYLARKLGYPTELVVGSDYADLGGADIAFVCGLAYVEHARSGSSRLEPLVAPVLQGDRYQGKPIYFSDVIVRRESPFQSFADLRGRSWAYNEPYSQSGYGVTRFHLASRCQTTAFFGAVVEAGWHERAIQMVCSGEVDGSAIDSHVLAIAVRQDPSLARRLRVIEALGPSPIQPVVAAEHLSQQLKDDLRAILLGIADHPQAKPQLDRAFVDRFETVTDASYDEIRRMQAVTEAADFVT